MDDSRRHGIDVLTDCAGKVRFSFFFAPLGGFCELTIFAYANDGGSRSREQSRDVSLSGFIIECKWK